MSDRISLINSDDSTVRRNFCKQSQIRSCVIFVLICIIIYLVVDSQSGPSSEQTDQYNHRQADFDSLKLLEKQSVSSATLSSSQSSSTSAKSDTTTTKTTTTFTSTLVPSTSSVSSLATTISSTISSPSQLIPGQQYYVSIPFFATCSGGGISNKIYEFVSLYGIARTLNRIPYGNLMNDCLQSHMKDMTSYFPQLALSIELKFVAKNLNKEVVDFAPSKCCTYDNVTKLTAYNNSRFLALSSPYLQSYKYFHQYRADVLKLMTFTDEDIAVTDKIANETFKNDRNHKLCVHIRRGDYLKSQLHQVTTENFTMNSVLYVREKLIKAGVNTSVALLGDDRPWAKALFANFSWAYVPERSNRTTTDYAFVARHCQTIILTASASTFGFWSAYLSSAENVYYNEKFSISSQLTNEFNAEDVFLPTWIPLRQDNVTYAISEVPRR